MEPLKNIDEMLEKLQGDDTGKSSGMTYKQALAFHAEVSDEESDELLVLIKDLENELVNIEKRRDKLDQQESHFDGLLSQAQSDFIRVMRDIKDSADAEKAGSSQDKPSSSEPAAKEKVDEAKISMPQVIDQIADSLDILTKAEDPHESVDALRDIISAVAGGLIKLGEKKSAAALSKIAMEIQPSDEPAVATSKESTSFANI